MDNSSECHGHSYRDYTWVNKLYLWLNLKLFWHLYQLHIVAFMQSVFPHIFQHSLMKMDGMHWLNAWYYMGEWPGLWAIYPWLLTHGWEWPLFALTYILKASINEHAYTAVATCIFMEAAMEYNTMHLKTAPSAAYLHVLILMTTSAQIDEKYLSPSSIFTGGTKRLRILFLIY